MVFKRFYLSNSVEGVMGGYVVRLEEAFAGYIECCSYESFDCSIYWGYSW